VGSQMVAHRTVAATRAGRALQGALATARGSARSGLAQVGQAHRRLPRGGGEGGGKQLGGGGGAETAKHAGSPCPVLVRP